MWRLPATVFLVGLVATTSVRTEWGSNHFDAVSLFQHRKEGSLHTEAGRDESDANATESSHEEVWKRHGKPGALAAALANSATKKVASSFFNAFWVSLPTVIAALSNSMADLPAASCTPRDHQEMNSSLLALDDALDLSGLPARFRALRDKCNPDQILVGGVDYARAAECFHHAFNVSVGCADCHAEGMKAFFGEDMYDLGCIPQCLEAEEGCREHVSSRACFETVAKCMDCARPSLASVLGCHGYPRTGALLRSFEGCVERTSKGQSRVKAQARHIVDYLTECFFELLPEGLYRILDPAGSRVRHLMKGAVVQHAG